eukprot:scaffold291083_cov28-Tisochrysis_lutea.AAC.3
MFRLLHIPVRVAATKHRANQRFECGFETRKAQGMVVAKELSQRNSREERLQLLQAERAAPVVIIGEVGGPQRISERLRVVPCRVVEPLERFTPFSRLTPPQRHHAHDRPDNKRRDQNGSEKDGEQPREGRDEEDNHGHDVDEGNRDEANAIEAVRRLGALPYD